MEKVDEKMRSNADKLIATFLEKSEHPLVHMRDARTAHSLLNCCGHEEVHLCPCCLRLGQDECPYRGNERTGICEHYALDERDIAATYVRGMDAIRIHAERRTIRIISGV